MRENAIFWLGQAASSEKVINQLKDFVLNDKNPNIQDKALFAISQLDDDQGIPFLIDIAKNHKDTRIRKKAIFWLGQSDDERASEALEDILYKK